VGFEKTRGCLANRSIIVNNRDEGRRGQPGILRSLGPLEGR
jgi:hypothetical protein